jgi:hypothetical protein
MSANYSYVAVLAVLIVAVTFGSGLITGNVSVHSSPHSNLNFYVNSVSFPAKFTPGTNSYHATATVTNSGLQSASFVYYRLDVYSQGGRYAGVDGFVNLGAGETKTFDLPDMSDLTAGTYSATFTLDTGYRYTETNELDNTYKTTFDLTY